MIAHFFTWNIFNKNVIDKKNTTVAFPRMTPKQAFKNYVNQKNK